MLAPSSTDRRSRRLTKTIGSLDLPVSNSKILDSATSDAIDAIRLVVGDKLGDVPQALEAVRSHGTDRRQHYLPVVLDLGPSTRGFVADGTRANLDVAYGTELQLRVIHAHDQQASPSGRLDVQIATQSPDGFFASEATVYFGYGHVVAKVVGDVGRDGSAQVQVIQGGTLQPGMAVHVPATRPRPTLKGLDVDVLASLAQQGADYLIIPGVTDPAEVGTLRMDLARRCRVVPWILIRVDSLEVIDQLRALLDHVAGVYISRLDLALVADPATVPMLTKEVTQTCNARGKLVVTASEMLASMRQQPLPTRAEVSDIANSILDGSDAVVVPEDVLAGGFAQDAVDSLGRVIESIENENQVQPNWIKLGPSIATPFDAVAWGAFKTAQRVRAKAIVCITREGNTALRLASFRESIPIVAVTFSPEVLRRLALLRGVEGVLLDSEPTIDDILPRVNELLVQRSWLRAGDKIIFVSITLSSVGRESSNLFTIQQLT